jgi:hypothetical protein
VSNATGFSKLLTSKFSFEYAGEPLTEKGATREAIVSLIDDDLRRRKACDGGDNGACANTKVEP